jgi:hypothetical protein
MNPSWQRERAWATWSSANADETLAIIERFRAAGVPLVLVDEEKADTPGSYDFITARRARDEEE